MSGYTALCLRCWCMTPILDAQCEPTAPDGGEGERNIFASDPRHRRGALRQMLPFWLKMMDDDPYRIGDYLQKKDLKLICECGEALPSAHWIREKERDTNAIRIVGPTGSGKTLYIASVIARLRQGSDLSMLGLMDTDKRIGDIVDAFMCGNKPESTPVASKNDGRERHYAWRIGYRKKEDLRRLLAIHDIAGETWEGVENAHSVVHRFIGYPGHLLLIIDGAQIAHDLGLPTDDWVNLFPSDSSAMSLTILSYIANQWGWHNPARKRVRIALVITKADLLWAKYPTLRSDEPDNPTVHNEVRRILGEARRLDILNTAETFFKECKVFLTSSIGYCPTKDKLDEFSQTLKDPPQPHGVLEPLIWLLDLEKGRR